jgi:hypothetical protein
VYQYPNQYLYYLEEQRKRPGKQAHTGEDEADTAYGAADGAGDYPRYKNRVVAHPFISRSLFIFCAQVLAP